MNDLEELGDPIEDIKKALKLLEHNNIYCPNDGKFKISKEMHDYIMEANQFRWGLDKDD